MGFDDPNAFFPNKKAVVVNGWKIEYTYENDKVTVFSILRMDNSASDTLTIPAYIDNKEVVKICRGTNKTYFATHRSPDEIIFPKTLKYCTGMGFKPQKMQLPDGLEFFTMYGASIKELVIPEGVKTFIFTGDPYLEKIVIPDGVEDFSFVGCTALKEVTIPQNTKAICSSAFKECSALETVEIPESVTVIEEEAFRECINLKSINIPDGVTRIDEFAFAGCKSLTSINIPDKAVGNLGRYAFRDCTSLKDVKMNSEFKEEYLKIFKNAPFLKSYTKDSPYEMIIRDNILMFYGGDSKSVEILEGVTEIAKGCFYDMDIEDVKFSSTVRKIGEQAFVGTKLKKVYIPATVKTICQFAFSYIDTLEEVEFEDKDQFPQIGLGAFMDCANLSKVTLPKKSGNSESGVYGNEVGGKSRR